jgi:hypothetical protein
MRSSLRTPSAAAAQALEKVEQAVDVRRQLQQRGDVGARLGQRHERLQRRLHLERRRRADVRHQRANQTGARRVRLAGGEQRRVERAPGIALRLHAAAHERAGQSDGRRAEQLDGALASHRGAQALAAEQVARHEPPRKRVDVALVGADALAQQQPHIRDAERDLGRRVVRRAVVDHSAANRQIRARVARRVARRRSSRSGALCRQFELIHPRLGDVAPRRQRRAQAVDQQRDGIGLG